MANEKRLIEYDAVYQYASDGVHGGGLEHEDFDAIINAIDAVPIVDAVEMVRARWAHLGGDEWCCTACGNVMHTEGSWEKPVRKYCDECGAKMDRGNGNG